MTKIQLLVVVLLVFVSALEAKLAAQRNRVQELRTRSPVVTTIRGLEEAGFEDADLKILFIGNSHTMDSPEYLYGLIQHHQPDKNIVIARSAAGFLVDHLRNERTLKLIKAGGWDAVVLQAQKYSTSGRYHYPYDGAIGLTKIAKTRALNKL